MNKILLIFATVFCLQSNAQIQRTILMEEFEGASSPTSALQNPQFNTLLSNNLDKVVPLKYHVSFVGVDPMGNQNQVDVSTRQNLYKVTGVPLGFMDGDSNQFIGTSYLGAPANMTQAKINTRYAITSPLSVNTSYSYNSLTDSITSVVTIINVTPNAINASSAGKQRLEFALVEMNIEFATPPGSNGETEFYYVMRSMLPDANGTILPDVINPGQTLSFTFKFKKPAYIYKPAQMAVIAFVQDFGTLNVLQTAIGRPANTVDLKMVSSSVITTSNLCNSSINPKLTITNNGTNPITSATLGYTINGLPGYSQPWAGNLSAFSSATITMPIITAPSGVNSYKFFSNNINNGAVDIMGANNFVTPIVTNVLDNFIGNPFKEDFENNVVNDKYTDNSIFTPISLTSNVADKTINPSLTYNLGGYGLSNNSFLFDCYNIPQGGRPTLIFYKYNTIGQALTHIKFDYAYNGYLGNGINTYDSFAVKVSIDCGASWTTVWLKESSALKTTTAPNINNAGFYPKGNEWFTAYATIPSNLANSTELVVAFEGRSGYGNFIYLDNIKMISIPDAVNTFSNLNANIFPVPANSNVTVSADVSPSEITTITILDAVGKIVFTKNANNISILNEVINVETLASGIYAVNIINGVKSIKKTITVQH
jgi:hypothetical protein